MYLNNNSNSNSNKDNNSNKDFKKKYLRVINKLMLNYRTEKYKQYLFQLLCNKIFKVKQDLDKHLHKDKLKFHSNILNNRLFKINKGNILPSNSNSKLDKDKLRLSHNTNKECLNTNNSSLINNNN